jgi:hypothetical protein
MNSRTNLIKKISKFEVDIEPFKAELNGLPYDCDEALYLLTRADVLKVFERYLSDEITTKELSGWANYLECREDFGYETSSEEVLDRVIFWLANPEINYPVNKSLVHKLKVQVWNNKI